MAAIAAEIDTAFDALAAQCPTMRRDQLYRCDASRH
jgi:hypothetical protein